MGQLVMYHLMDAFAEHPVPKGFFVRNYRPGEEQVWIEINKCGIFGPNVGMDGWENMVVKMAGLVPERDILFDTCGRHSRRYTHRLCLCRWPRLDSHGKRQGFRPWAWNRQGASGDWDEEASRGHTAAFDYTPLHGRLASAGNQGLSQCRLPSRQCLG